MNPANIQFSVKQLRLPIAALLTLVLVGGLYSVVNTQITLMGARVINLRERAERLQRENHHLELEIAIEIAPGKILPRAQVLGLRPVTPSQTIYLVVKNYPIAVPKPTASPPSSVASRSADLLDVLRDLLARLGFTSGTGAAEAGSTR
jgi:hypothetical protein